MDMPGPLDIPPANMVIFAVETARDAIVFEVALDPPGARILDARDHASVIAVELGEDAAVATVNVGATLLYADGEGEEHTTMCDKATLLRIDMPGVLSTDCVAGHILDCLGAEDELADEGRTWRHTRRVSATVSAERAYWHM
ncbi:MAG: hypothetical protein KA063_02485 [Firmicutes bacterium]|jgi:hypothetical protein|nr:hypothetical protein [Bacillota bacterium]